MVFVALVCVNVVEEGGANRMGRMEGLGVAIYIVQRSRLRFRLYSMCQLSRMSRPRRDGSPKVSLEYEMSRSMS